MLVSEKIISAMIPASVVQFSISDIVHFPFSHGLGHGLASYFKPQMFACLLVLEM